MGFIQKAVVTANPARKNGTIFQNSYTTTEQYQTGYWIYEYEQVYISSWDVYRRYIENGRYVRREYIGNTTTLGSYGSTSVQHPTYGTRTVTRWNTKWSKR